MPKTGQNLLDVSCGYFSQHFKKFGLQVTRLDSALSMLELVKLKDSKIKYIEGSMKGFTLR